MWTSKFSVLALVIPLCKLLTWYLILYIGLISFTNVNPPLRDRSSVKVLIKISIKYSLARLRINGVMNVAKGDP